MPFSYCARPIIAVIGGYWFGGGLEMILTAPRIAAAEALRVGLVERVVAAGEALKAAHELAATLAAKAPVALRYAKEAVVKDVELLLRTTEDRLDGAKVFLEKRKPRWQGR